MYQTPPGSVRYLSVTFSMQAQMQGIPQRMKGSWSSPNFKPYFYWPHCRQNSIGTTSSPNGFCRDHSPFIHRHTSCVYRDNEQISLNVILSVKVGCSCNHYLFIGGICIRCFRCFNLGIAISLNNGIWLGSLDTYPRCSVPAVQLTLEYWWWPCRM